MTITITPINDKPDFSNLFDLFHAGKVVPTASHALAEIREFVVGQRVEGLVLPEASGGTAPLTYRLSPALPADFKLNHDRLSLSGILSLGG